MRNRKKKGDYVMNLPENIQAGLANINAKAELNTEIKNELKAADNVHTQIGGNTTYNNDNFQQIIHKNFFAILSSNDFNNVFLQLTKQERENLQFVGNEFQKHLKDNNISDEVVLQKLENPEFVDTLKNAGRISKKTSNIEMKKELSNLIYKKILADTEEESLLVSSAITEMENITSNHLQILGFLYIVQETNFSKYSHEEFIKIYNKCLIDLINFERENAKNMSHYLSSTRVINSRAMGWGIESFLPKFNETINDNIKNNIYEINQNLKEKADNIDFTGIILTPIGEQIAKIYLFNKFGFVPDKKSDERITTKDFAEDVSASELTETLEEINKNQITWEEIKTEE